MVGSGLSVTLCIFIYDKIFYFPLATNHYIKSTTFQVTGTKKHDLRTYYEWSSKICLFLVLLWSDLSTFPSLNLCPIHKAHDNN